MNVYSARELVEIIRGYKVELDPNDRQRTRLGRFAEVRRFVFNIGLREWQRQYKQGQKPSAYGLKKQFNAVKDELFPDVRDAPYAVTEKAFGDLGKAFKHFFRRVRQGKEPGYPRIKQYPGGFALRGTVVDVDRVRLQGLGWMRLKERDFIPATASGLKFGTYATLSSRAGHWFQRAQGIRR